MNKRHFDLVARDALSMNTGESCATWDGSLVFHFADAGTAGQLQHNRSTIARIHLLSMSSRVYVVVPTVSRFWTITFNHHANMSDPYSKLGNQ